MMLGTVPTSVPQFILLGNGLLGGDYRRKWQQLRYNKIFWTLSSVFLIHVLGLAYTTDFTWGWNDVRTKIPLMFLPLIFFSEKPLSQKELYTVCYCFIAGCVANTVWCILYSFVLHNNEIVRNASRFMSHIRLGLYLNIAITVCAYFIWKSSKLSTKILFSALVVYFIYVMYLLGLASGLANLLILTVVGLLILVIRQKLWVKLAALLALLTTGFIVSNYVIDIKNHQLSIRNTPNNMLSQKTPWGKPYIHFDTLGQRENGNYVYINIELDELKREWAKRFPEDSFDYASQHNIERYNVLVRYLASKGLNKDSSGVAQLTEKDVANVKNNVVNYEYPEWSFMRKRVYELVNEYDDFVNNRFVSGHSLTMRLYFWKSAIHVIQKYPLFGVGTGDVQFHIEKTYEETQSPLEKEWYKRPHNQFLTVTVALGVVGLLVFLFCLFYPAVHLRRFASALYWPFLLIAVISFLMEDTLETQAGLSFFAFFNSLYLSQAWFKKRQTPGG